MTSRAPDAAKYFESRFKLIGGVIRPTDCSTNSKPVDRSQIESFFKQARESNLNLAEQKNTITESTGDAKPTPRANSSLNEPSNHADNPNKHLSIQNQENPFVDSKSQSANGDINHQAKAMTTLGHPRDRIATPHDRHVPNPRISSGKVSPIAFRKSSKCHDEIELLYDFYTEKFKFSTDELQQNEPVPEYCWMHLSCIYWIPELFLKDHINNLDQRSITNIDKNRFRTPCIICNSTRGAAISCSFEDCEEHFHTECARRAKLYLEIRTTTHTKFLIYCPKHTPLLFKNTLHSQDKKAREDISKFHRYFKRFFRNRKILPDQIDIKEKIEEDQMSDISVEEIIENAKIPRGKKEKVQKPKKPERPKREHMVKFLKFDQKFIISKLKKKMSADKNFMFQVTLRWFNDDAGYQVTDTNVPDKSIYTHKVPKATPVWKEIAAETQSTLKAVYNKFQKAIEDLKYYEKNPPSFEPTSELKARETAHRVNGHSGNDFEEEFPDEVIGRIIRLR